MEITDFINRELNEHKQNFANTQVCSTFTFEQIIDFFLNHKKIKTFPIISFQSMHKYI